MVQQSLSKTTQKSLLKNNSSLGKDIKIIVLKFLKNDFEPQAKN